MVNSWVEAYRDMIHRGDLGAQPCWGDTSASVSLESGLAAVYIARDYDCEADMSTIYTPLDRQRVLDLLLAQLAQDDCIAAVIIIGSGARGFLDEHSDIDLAAVVADGLVVREVWEDWRQRVRELLVVWGCSEVTHNPENYLLVLMLEGYLEVDLGFIGMGGDHCQTGGVARRF